MKLFLKSGLLAAMMIALVGASSAHAAKIYGGALTASACHAAKAKCVIKMKGCLLGCYNKAVGKGLAPDPTCLDKCRNGFQSDLANGKGCSEKADIKGGIADCGSSFDDSAVVRSKVEAHAGDLYGQLVPGNPGALGAGGVPPLNKCTAGKIKCVLKYDACVLGIVAKAMKAGGLPGSLDKCNAILTDDYLGNGKLSCVGKLEDKNDPLGATPCLTYQDQGALRTADDAFVNDIIAGLEKGQLNMKSRRCFSNTATPCPNGDIDCSGGAGDCRFFFGSPLPLAAGGTATCVVSQWNGGISGTFNQASGASAGTAAVISRVYVGGSTSEPCPRCAQATIANTVIPNDGVNDGTCTYGARAGLGCDANGESPVPSFGYTSLACPPNPGSLAGTLPVDLTNTNSGTVTNTLAATSPNCNGAPGKKCMCATCSLNSSIPCRNDSECASLAAGACNNAAGEPRQPHACVDDTTTTADCATLAGGEGACAAGPTDQRCNIERFRGCLVNTDCPAPGDTCGSAPRPCFPGYNGSIGDTITASGTHGAPHNDTGTSNFASLFCVAPTGSSAVNLAAGLPGPGRLVLGGVSSENGALGVCPTRATFLPTSKGGALDSGWTGLAHNARVVGQGKVTVSATCAGVPGSCNCTYSGPIENFP